MTCGVSFSQTHLDVNNKSKVSEAKIQNSRQHFTQCEVFICSQVLDKASAFLKQTYCALFSQFPEVFVTCTQQALVKIPQECGIKALVSVIFLPLCP